MLDVRSECEPRSTLRLNDVRRFAVEEPQDPGMEPRLTHGDGAFEMTQRWMRIDETACEGAEQRRTRAIRAVAQKLWLEHGGNDVVNWLVAEAMVDHLMEGTAARA